MAPQFNYTTSERRASTTIVGSLGRSGLYVPQDFIRQNPQEIENLLQEDADDTDDIESQSRQSITSNSSIDLLNRSRPHRASIIILNDEARLLQANNVPIRKHSTAQLAPTSPPAAYGATATAEPDDIEETWNEAIKSGKIGTTPKFELKQLTASSIPLVITFLLQNSLGVCSVFAVGHISPEALAGITLGTMSSNITAMAVIAGLASSLDTFLPQAYGAGKYKLVGLIFQRCTALIFVIMFFVCISWWLFAESLLGSVLPDPESARLAALYLKVTSFGVPGYICFETGKRFLQAQSIFDASTYVLFVCAPLNAVMNYLFVWKLGFGYIGAPIAVSINYTLMAVGLFLYTITTKHETKPLKCWDGLNLKKAFSKWGELVKLSIPNLIMIMSEFLSFEILTLMSSYLGTKSLAAQSVVSTMASLTYQIPYGVSIAASTRIANFLGAGLPKAAHISAKMVLLLTAILATMDSSFLFFGRYMIAKWFTNDEKVIEIVGRVFPLIAFIQIFDAFNATSAGCLRGQGLQKIGGIVNLISYYIIGLPLAFYLAFYFPKDSPMGLFGLWTGVCIALAIIGAVQTYCVINADYDQLIEDAIKRSNSD